jgi:hypothetical protein
MIFSAMATAKAATPVAADQKEDIRVLGKLNVNEASREQLLTVPGLNEQAVDAILSQRQKGAILDLATIPITPDALPHLKTSGPSDYRRIRQLPLQVLELVRTAAR